MVYNKNVLDWLAPDALNVMTWIRILSLTLDFYIIYYLFNIYFFRYLEYKIKDGLVSF